MSNTLQNFQSEINFSAAPASATEGEISAVALLKLMMRAETSSANLANDVDTARSYAINDSYQPAETLSPYLQEQLTTIAESIFDQRNYQFYCTYRGAGRGEQPRFEVTKEDLRPLAYRALMYESFEKPIEQKPFSPRFAASLLLLQKYWDYEFLQAYKDVAGRLSADSMRSLLK